MSSIILNSVFGENLRPYSIKKNMRGGLHMIAEYHQMLTPRECQLLIEYGSKSLKSLTVVGSDNKDRYRVGDGTWIYHPIMSDDGVDINQKIKKICSKLTGLPLENQENVHLVKYGIGGEYKEHHDFFHPTGPEFTKHYARGGQRAYTLLFYLNDGFEGGETKFVKKNISVKASVGKMLMWSNLNEGDLETLDYESKHAGLPVVKGEKWIAIVWVRQRNFR